MSPPSVALPALPLPPPRANPAAAFLRVVMLVLALLPAARAHALDPARHIAQFHHTAWTVQEGAPGGITALAQTGDGYLWLATQVGLFRFDGATFDRFETGGGDEFPAASISTLYAPAGGGLWIGYRYGSVSFIDDHGHATHYDEAQGLPTSTVYRIAEEADGTLWAATFSGLFRRDGTRWLPPGRDWGLPAGVARTVFVDRDGTLWVASDDAVHYRRKGATRFQTALAGAGRVVQFAQAADGSLWVADLDGGVRPLPSPGNAPAAPVLGRSSAGLLFDRDGGLWATTLGDGLVRLPQPLDPRHRSDAAAPVQHFEQSMGLSSDNLLPVLEDREGTIWVGGSRGLDRFRHSNLVPAMVPAGSQDFALAAGAGGRILAGSRNQPLMALRASEAIPLEVAPPITAAYRDRAGVAWLGGPGGLWRLQDGTASRVAPLPVERYSGVQAIAMDGQGALWVSLNIPGVFRLRDGRWEHLRPGDIAGFPGESSPLVLLPAADGTLWMGFARNRIVVLGQGGSRSIDEAAGLHVGNVSALYEGDAGIWIGGERGIALATRDGIRNRVSAEGSAFRGISGIVQAADGALWLNGARGVVQVAAGEVARLFDPDGRGSDASEPAHRLYDHLDGLPGVAAQFRPLPTAVRADDGRLWFTTTNGVVSVDPAAIRRNPLPPPVQVLSLRVDGRPVPLAGQALELPPGSTNLQFGYTALSLSMPERVRFRYRLEGHDGDWQDAGTRRVAFYNNVRPGRYAFHVEAANEDGVWNSTGAALAFAVEPRFYQTWWFVLLCVLLVAGSLWLAYLVRLRQLGRHIRGRLQERHAERERIARELHDTLLQSIHGLILRFQAVSETLPPLDPARSAMEHALQRADDVLVEGRDRVLDLRATAPDAGDLEDLLAAAGDELAPLADARLEIATTGSAEALDPIVRDELYRIGREAILNAFRHAGAEKVGVEIDYGRSEMRLRVFDDGRGIDAQTLARGGRPGHWGLHGMRERAERIGARLRVWSRPGAGTEVELRIASGSAYRPCLKASRRAWLRAIFGPRTA